MRSSDLYDFIGEKITGEKFAVMIVGEVEMYKTLLKKIGSIISLHFVEDRELVIDIEAVKTLIQKTYDGEMSNVSLAYICDCLTLGEFVNFENEIIKDIIYEIADPEINGGFKNDQDLKNYLKRLIS